MTNTQPIDPLAAALASMPAAATSHSKVDAAFKDRPEVLDALRSARRDKRLSIAQIAALIEKIEPAAAVSPSTLGVWFRKQGIE